MNTILPFLSLLIAIPVCASEFVFNHWKLRSAAASMQQTTPSPTRIGNDFYTTFNRTDANNHLSTTVPSAIEKQGLNSGTSKLNVLLTQTTSHVSAACQNTTPPNAQISAFDPQDDGMSTPQDSGMAEFLAGTFLPTKDWEILFEDYKMAKTYEAKYLILNEIDLYTVTDNNKKAFIQKELARLE